MGKLRVGIWWNPEKPQGLALAAQLAQGLLENGALPVLDAPLAELLDLGAYVTPKGVMDDSDMLAVLGGDGTLLYVAIEAARRGLPLLGINLGRLGFLTEIEPAMLGQSVAQLTRGEYWLEERTTLLARIPGEEPLYALNDVVVSRSSAHASTVSLAVYVNGVEMDRFLADGIIISSPTGSTGYSLSAGGPVVDPRLPCIVLSPICPHTLRSRPTVLPDSTLVEISLQQGEGAMLVTLDGRSHAHMICGEDRLSVTSAPLKARFVRLYERNFYHLLRGKLSEWSR